MGRSRRDRARIILATIDRRSTMRKLTKTKVSRYKSPSAKTSRKTPPVAKSSRTKLGNGNAETPRYEGQLITALQAVREGDFSVRLPDDWSGQAGQIANRFNEVVTVIERMTYE